MASFSQAQNSYAVDLEDQTMTSTVPSIPLVPQPALTHNSHASPIDLTTNPVDDFFGYTLSWTPTRDSRHDRPTSEVLPAYVDDLPGYTQKAETPTLAQYLFKFGFLFPPFWILGAIILLSPLQAPAPTSSESPSTSWLPEKTEAERQQFIAHIRRAEVKWAWRCLLALIAVILAGTAIGITVWAVMRT